MAEQTGSGKGSATAEEGSLFMAMVRKQDGRSDHLRRPLFVSSMRVPVRTKEFLSTAPPTIVSSPPKVHKVAGDSPWIADHVESKRGPIYPRKHSDVLAGMQRRCLQMNLQRVLQHEPLSHPRHRVTPLTLRSDSVQLASSRCPLIGGDAYTAHADINEAVT